MLRGRLQGRLRVHTRKDISMWDVQREEWNAPTPVTPVRMMRMVM